MNVQAQIFKELLENMTDMEMALTSPFNFFVMIVPNLYLEKYIYWYAYSLGKINNVIWGYYRQKDSKFKIKGICGIYDFASLNEIIKIKKEQGFLLVSQLTEDNINKTINKYLDSGKIQHTLNRQDILIKLDKNNFDFIKKLSNEFLYYISHNLVLTTKSKKKCNIRNNCDLKTNPNDSCQVYDYGYTLKQKKDYNKNTYELI